MKFGTSTQLRTASKDENEIDVNKPVPFKDSGAHRWKAEYSRRGTNAEPRLWYEAHVVSLSLAVFLLYFCVFREESDIDEELGRSLYSRIDGLEEVQLRLSYKYNLENGLDVKDIERRMRELDMNKDSK